MYGALDISTSGLVAQRTRLTVATNNLVNARTILNAAGEYEPYRRQSVILSAGDPASPQGQGVRAVIQASGGPLRAEFEPNSPYADADGYVHYPNVDPVIEQMNAMQALRSYEANITAIEATKSMVSVALEMLA